MKKIYLSITAIAISASAFSQTFIQQRVTSSVAKDVVLPVYNGSASTPDDTLGFDELGAQLFQYGSDAGYVFGANVLAFPAPNEGVFQFNTEFARGFIVDDAQNVIGAGFIFGSKSDASGSPAAAKAKLYNVEPNKALSALVAPPVLDADGPGSTVIASADLAFSDADTVFPNITWVDFDTEGWVSSDFAIGLDIKALYGTPSDTLVLLADEHNDSDGESTWTKFTQGADANGTTLWARSTALLQSDLFVNLAIFAVVAESPNSIEEQGYMNGVKVTMYPNPAVSSENVTIQYGLETSAKNVDLSIVNVNGQVVYTAAQGAKASGIYTMNVPAGTLSSGSYIYVLNADGARIAKRMEILK